MTNVIVRNVLDDDVKILKRAAANSGMSLQAYLAMELHNKAVQLRRRAAISRLRARRKDHSLPEAAEIVGAMAEMRRQRDAGLGKSE